MYTMDKTVTCEQVSRAHVDKVCDQIADAIVTDCLQNDRNSRVAVECLFKENTVVIAGEITSRHNPDYAKLAHRTFNLCGIADQYEDVRIETIITRQSPDIAQGVDNGGAGDQGVMYGYATNETPEMLPIPYAVATRFLDRLREVKAPMLLPDAKAQVTYDYDEGCITVFLCSVQHTPDSKPEDFRPIIENLMNLTAAEYGLDTDFDKIINPTGKFVVGGSQADTGVTGRKLACDTYGGVGRIGGGALSGKDPSKVDRSGAYMARKIARDLVEAGYCSRCEVALSYAIGMETPISVSVETFGTARVCPACIDKYVSENYDLSPRGIIKQLYLLDVDYNYVSYGGHFGKDWLPWEMDDEEAEAYYGNND